jgi:hypothetical protein
LRYWPPYNGGIQVFACNATAGIDFNQIMVTMAEDHSFTINVASLGGSVTLGDQVPWGAMVFINRGLWFPVRGVLHNINILGN